MGQFGRRPRGGHTEYDRRHNDTRQLSVHAETSFQALWRGRTRIDTASQYESSFAHGFIRPPFSSSWLLSTAGQKVLLPERTVGRRPPVCPPQESRHCNGNRDTPSRRPDLAPCRKVGRFDRVERGLETPDLYWLSKSFSCPSIHHVHCCSYEAIAWRRDRSRPRPDAATPCRHRAILIGHHHYRHGITQSLHVSTSF